jgi:hypothetical protein
MCRGWKELREEALVEMTNQMAEVFEDEKACGAAVSKGLANNQFMPTVADLHQLAEEFREREDVPIDRDCASCGGSGFKQAWELITYTGGFNKRGIPLSTVDRITWEQYREMSKEVDGINQKVSQGATACHCAYGKHLRHARLVDKEAKNAG